MPEPTDPGRTVATPQDQHSSASGDRDETAASASRAGPVGPNFAAPAAPGEVGTLGPYRVVKELGKGGMGAVYLAVDTRLDRKLALKVMLPEFAADAAAKERFLREAKAAAKIAHDNVVTVYEADERDGVAYIAMQFLQGYPLDDYLRQKGAPPLPHVIRIARETALGLAAAHALGLVHRDIKPANLWLESPNGRVKVLDFGLAKPVGADAELTRSGAVVGTPAYMSPEQARGLKVDSRTDLFSLGAVLYRLCTGRTPFEGPNVMAVLMALGTEEPAPVRTLNPAVPESLAQLIHQLLAKKPEDRPQTAAEVAKRLRAVLDQLLAPPAPAPAAPAAPAPELSLSQPLVVHPLPAQPPLVAPMEVTAAPESVFADLGADEPTRAEAAERPKPRKPERAGTERKPSGGKWVVFAVGGALLLAGVAVAVVLATRGKKDEPVVENKQPDGGVPGGNDAKGKSPKAAEPKGALPPLPAWAPPAPVPVGASPLDKLDPKEIPAEERFDWQPKELVAVVGTHARKHWGHVLSAAVSPDGKWAVTTNTHRNQIWLWDLATHASRAVPLPTPDAHFVSATFSPDGRKLYLDFPKGMTVYSFLAPAPGYEAWPGWEKADGVFPAENAFGQPRFSPDGRAVLLHSAGFGDLGWAAVQVWDNAAPKPRLVKTVEKPGHFLGFSADGAAVVYARRAEAGKPWEITALPLAPGGEPKVLLTTPPDTHPVLQGEPAMALSPDGTTLAVLDKGGWSDGGTLYDLTANPPKEKARFKTPREGGIRFSPDGKTLAWRYTDVELIDVTATPPKAAGRIPCATSTPGPFAFTPDGRAVVMGEGDGAVRFWDVSGAEPKELAPIPPGVRSSDGNPSSRPVFAPGKALLGVQRTDLCGQFWDLTGPKPKPWPDGQARFGENVPGYLAPIVALLPDGTGAAFNPGGAGTQVLKRTDKGFEEAAKGHGPQNSGFFTGGKGLVGPRRLDEPGAEAWHLWDIREPFEKARPLPGVAPAEGAVGAALDPYARLLAVLRRNNRTDLWNIQGEKPALVTSLEGLSPPTFSPDGRFLARGGSDGPEVYDLGGRTPARLPEFPTGTRNVAAVAFTPDAKRVATATLQGHLEVFDVATRARLWEAKLPGGAWWLAFAEDGRHLLTHNANGTIYVLRLPDPTGAADRAAAEWALSVGGKVTIKDAAGEKEVAAAKDLPAGPLLVSAVVLWDCGDRVTDAGLEKLKGLTAVGLIHLGNTAVTDAGLEHLKGFERLMSLVLLHTKITDAGLSHLREMKHLTNLALDYTNITDAGLAHLKGLDLHSLRLTDTKVTDAGLEYLKGMGGLTELLLTKTKVTPVGVAKLQKALPDCKIYWDASKK